MGQTGAAGPDGRPGQAGGAPGRGTARIGLALVLGVAGAALAKLASLPLPYLLGPLLATAVAALAGAPVLALPYGRELGQVAVGLAIGLRFIPEVLAATLSLLPLMALATALTILSTTVAAVMMERLGGTDRRTSFFATAAAGLAEMAVTARAKGADADTVAVVHLVRVTAIVTTVPFLVTAFGADGGIVSPTIPLGREFLPLAFLLAASTAAAFLARPLKMPNSWLLVPAALGAIVAGTGFGPFEVPSPLLTVAQVVIGIWLGCRFRREALSRLPRVTAAAGATTLFLVAFASGLALMVSAVSGLPFATSLLAVAPAGVTEMVLTATAMHLDAASVTAFQIMRIAVVMTTILFALRAFESIARRL